MRSEYPMFGLGCASGVRREHVKSAMDLGYRFVDTAQAHQWGYHEADVGEVNVWCECQFQFLFLDLMHISAFVDIHGALMAVIEALAETSINRADVFIQTKVHPDDFSKDRIHSAVSRSLERLRTYYIDSVLLHRPGPGWYESWAALEELHQQGTIRHIGVSNVEPSLLIDLVTKHASVKPSVVQNWMDPFHQDDDMRKLCRDLGIVYQAYSSLGTQWKFLRELVDDKNPVQYNPVLQGIALENDLSVSQVVLTWLRQLGVSAIPASTHVEHQRANFEVFQQEGAERCYHLSEQQMLSIHELNGSEPGLPKESLVERTHGFVSVTFANRRTAPIQIFWLSGANERVLLATIDAGANGNVQSFPSHRFVAKLENGGEAVVTITQPVGSRQVFTLQ